MGNLACARRGRTQRVVQVTYATNSEETNELDADPDDSEQSTPTAPALPAPQVAADPNQAFYQPPPAVAPGHFPLGAYPGFQYNPILPGQYGLPQSPWHWQQQQTYNHNQVEQLINDQLQKRLAQSTPAGTPEAPAATTTNTTTTITPVASSSSSSSGNNNQGHDSERALENWKRVVRTLNRIRFRRRLWAALGGVLKAFTALQDPTKKRK